MKEWCVKELSVKEWCVKELYVKELCDKLCVCVCESAACEVRWTR